MKKIICTALLLFLLFPLSGKAQLKYSATFFDAFDTVITVIGYTDSEAEFNTCFAGVKDIFERYHRIFDQYHEYDGVNNLCKVNRLAPLGETPAEEELISILSWLKSAQTETNNRVNVAMGSVLSIWHTYREEGLRVPEWGLLAEAAKHTDFDCVILDAQKGTISYTDSLLSIDLGAVAKGYTAQIAGEWLRENGMPSFIINAGGNIVTGIEPQDGRSAWGIGIEDPRGGATQAILDIKERAIVTSGDYQRYYEVDGIRYHHLIDPDTLYPGQYNMSVTIVHPDSGFADLLSTTVFLMDYESGKALVDSIDGAEAYWILSDGTVKMTDGMKAYLR